MAPAMGFTACHESVTLSSVTVSVGTYDPAINNGLSPMTMLRERLLLTLSSNIASICTKYLMPPCRPAIAHSVSDTTIVKTLSGGEKELINTLYEAPALLEFHRSVKMAGTVSFAKGAIISGGRSVPCGRVTGAPST